MSQKKVRDFKNKTQFKILKLGSKTGQIKEVKRLSDGAIFILKRSVKAQEPGTLKKEYSYIKLFHKDLIHVTCDIATFEPYFANKQDELNEVQRLKIEPVAKDAVMCINDIKI